MQSHNNDTDALAHKAHDNYVDAINSGKTDNVIAMLTEDVVFMPPNSPMMVGHDSLRPWVQGYYDAFDTRWVKASLEFVVAGEWAFEQYTYHSYDTPKGSKETFEDVGKGIIIYHLDDDGTWRVARDAWNSDLPARSE